MTLRNMLDTKLELFASTTDADSHDLLVATSKRRRSSRISKFLYFVPSQAEVLKQWEEQLKRERSVFCKTAKIHAKLALKDGVIETVVNGAVEPRRSYKQGDFILQGTEGEQYTMGALDFAMRYDEERALSAETDELTEEGFRLYAPVGKIWAHELAQEEISKYFPASQFIASWGSPMTVDPGDYLAIPFPASGEVYRIKKNAFASTYSVLENYVPSQAEALAHWEGALRNDGGVYCKITKMHAKLAIADGVLETAIGGIVETSKSYEKGDFIMHGTQGERYTMGALDFAMRYERARPEPALEVSLQEEGFMLYRPTGKIWAYSLSEDDIATHFPAGEFIASWGSSMVVETGDFLAMPFPSGGELYRINAKAFGETYDAYRDYVPTQAEALAQWEGMMRREGAVYHKTTKMHAKLALEKGILRTVVDGVVETYKSYEAGDFIMCGTEGERYTMSALDFALRYERARPQKATGQALAEEGFQIYRPLGKIWAYVLSDEDVQKCFPAGQFVASWGSPMAVEAGDYLAMPFPAAGELYRIKQNAFANTYSLLTLDKHVPSQAEALSHWESILRHEGSVFVKVTKMHAKLALEDGNLVTDIGGAHETSKSYEKGDFIMHGTEGERYTMTSIDFGMRYDRGRPEPASTPALASEGFHFFRPMGKIWAHELSASDAAAHFPAQAFIASWGSPMTINPGDFLAIPFPLGGELYCIHKQAFGNTYTMHTLDGYVPSQAEALTHWEGELCEGRTYCKTAKVHAKLSLSDGEFPPTVLGREKYSKGDFILHDIEMNERYAMTSNVFAESYNHARPEPAKTAQLTEEGFNVYRPTGKIWARELTSEDIVTHFPAGQLVANWGLPIPIEHGDWLAMPYPAGGELYRVKADVFSSAYAPDHVPTQSEALSLWEGKLKRGGNVFCKTASVHAIIATTSGSLETVVGGVIQTQNTYDAGDYIVCGTQGERYIINALDFALRYDKARPLPASDGALAEEGFDRYQPTGMIWACPLSDGGMATYFPAGQFETSWESTMTIEEGDYVATPYPSGGEVWRIKQRAFSGMYASHVIKDHIPSQSELLSALGGRLRTTGEVFSKTAKVHAKLALKDGVLETIVDGVVEATLHYEKGDYIMLGSRGGRYPMNAIDFASRYERSRPEPAEETSLAEEGFHLYRPMGKIWAIQMTDEDVQTHFPASSFVGKWGGAATVQATDFLAMPNPGGGEIYRIKEALFNSTYMPFDDVPSQTEALSHWDAVLRRNGSVYCKMTKVHAKPALEDGVLETIVDGVLETRKPYKQGDFILRGTQNERYTMGQVDFEARYEISKPEPAESDALAAEGFQVYLPTGKIWGHELSADEVKAYFPAGQFIASWGSAMIVSEGDFLAMPFPVGGELYRIDRVAFSKTYTLADYVPSQAEALAQWQSPMQDSGSVYCKTTKMHGKLALADGVLQTVVNGVVETYKSYEKGDFIMSGTEGERYVMGALDFSMRYERGRPEPATTEELDKEGFQLYRPTGKIWGHLLTDAEVRQHFPAGQFVASWGSPMAVEAGDFLAMPFPVGGELYRIKSSAFANTYTLHTEDGFVPSQAEVLSHWEGALRNDGQIYCKTSKMHAKLASADGTIETIVDGIVEACNAYEKGDYIMHGNRGGRYPMGALDFATRYQNAKPEPALDPALGAEGFMLFRPTGKIWARLLTTDDIKRHFPASQFIGKWGGPVAVEPSDYLAMPYPAGGEVYRIRKNLFSNTYAPDNSKDDIVLPDAPICALDSAPPPQMFDNSGGSIVEAPPDEFESAQRKLLAISVRLPERRILEFAQKEVVRQLSTFQGGGQLVGEPRISC